MDRLSGELFVACMCYRPYLMVLALLRLSCPTCKREQFLNLLGFVNHCRILHKVKFATQGDAILACGTTVSEDEVPADDPCRHESLALFSSRAIRATTQVGTACTIELLLPILFFVMCAVIPGIQQGR